MNAILLISFFFFSLNVNSKTINLLHYNIKELDSTKIKDFIHDPNNKSQLHFVKKVMQSYQFDLLSLNEIQYDLPNVPNRKFQTTGKNLSLISHILNLEKYNEAFFEANTGKHAKKKPDGTYETNPGRGITYADPLNFGLFPGQYSTGLLSRFDIVEKNQLPI